MLKGIKKAAYLLVAGAMILGCFTSNAAMAFETSDLDIVEPQAQATGSAIGINPVSETIEYNETAGSSGNGWKKASGTSATTGSAVKFGPVEGSTEPIVSIDTKVTGGITPSAIEPTTPAAIVEDNTSKSAISKALEIINANNQGEKADVSDNQPSKYQKYFDNYVVMSNDNVSQAMDYLINERKDLNLSPYAAAGIVGNLIAESGCNPGKIEGVYGRNASSDYPARAGVGIGVAQWTTANRQRGLYNMAREMGLPFNNIKVQMAYLCYEMENNLPDMLVRLQNVESEAKKHGVSPTVEATIVFHGITNRIKGNPVIAAVNPSRGFEASGDSPRRILGYRCKVAEDILNEYKTAQMKQIIHTGAKVLGAFIYLKPDNPGVGNLAISLSSND